MRTSERRRLPDQSEGGAILKTRTAQKASPNLVLMVSDTKAVCRISLGDLCIFSDKIFLAFARHSMSFQSMQSRLLVSAMLGLAAWFFGIVSALGSNELLRCQGRDAIVPSKDGTLSRDEALKVWAGR